MGGSESTTRKVSFGLDEEDKVTVLQGIKVKANPKLSKPTATGERKNSLNIIRKKPWEDHDSKRDPSSLGGLEDIKLSSEVLQRMREASKSPEKPSFPKADSQKPGPAPAKHSQDETQEELRKRFEREQALLREELARLARREKEAVEDDLNSAVLRDRTKSKEEQKNAQNLAKQLARKDAELKHLAAFYKEQLLMMEKKNKEYYQQTSQIFNEDATKAESNIKPRNTVPICPELQIQVLNCYKSNRHQTLHCSSLAKEYMNCINSAKKNTMVNHGS